MLAEMTNAEVLKVVNAAERGEEIEQLSANGGCGSWQPKIGCWDFTHFRYRVKTAPKVKPVEFYVNLYGNFSSAFVSSCYSTADEAFANRAETDRYIRTILVREVPDDRCSELSRK